MRNGKEKSEPRWNTGRFMRQAWRGAAEGKSHVRGGVMRNSLEQHSLINCGSPGFKEDGSHIKYQHLQLELYDYFQEMSLKPQIKTPLKFNAFQTLRKSSDFKIRRLR